MKSFCCAYVGRFAVSKMANYSNESLRLSQVAKQSSLRLVAIIKPIRGHRSIHRVVNKMRNITHFTSSERQSDMAA